MDVKVVHIFSSLTRINFGIWNAGVFGARRLKERYGVESVVFVCTKPVALPPEMTIPVYFLGQSAASKKAIKILREINFTARQTIVVSHGAWLLPTRVAYTLKSLDYRWIYTPHGMLEAWSLANGHLKKILYWKLREGRMVRKADAIRAVSKIEQANLDDKLRRRVFLVENGVSRQAEVERTGKKVSFLFLGRLHYKKGVRPLVEAWKSQVGDMQNMKLTIAGPDEGELQHISRFINGNVEYTGPVYGVQKEELLKSHHYYTLPSFSEGFPTSVLEAMSYGLIPLVSKGCNFPEILEKDLGYQIEPDVDSIAAVLSALKDKAFDTAKSARNVEFVAREYSEEKICADLYSMYTTAISN